MKISSLSGLLFAVALLTPGCGTTKPGRPAAWSISITKVTPASIELDVVGVNPSDKQQWMNSVNVDDYWKPNSSIRAGARKESTKFESEKTWVLEKDHKVWSEWFGYGATEVMIIANLPGRYEPGPHDRRRIFLPLDKKVWESKDKTIKVEVQDAFIRVLTPQKPRD